MRRYVAAFVPILAAGCINTSVQRLDPAVRPALPPDQVALLAEEPHRPYTVIAVVESESQTVLDGFDDLRQAMIGKAAELGGEALILGPESTDSDFLLLGTAMIRSSRKKLSGQVIVFAPGR